MGKALNQVLGCTKHHQDARPSPQAGNVGIPLRHRFLVAPKSHLFLPNYGARSEGLQEQAGIPQGKMLLEPGWAGGMWSTPGFPRLRWQWGCAVPSPLPETPGKQPGLQIPVSDGPPARSSHPIPPWALPMFVLPTTSAAPQPVPSGLGMLSWDKQGFGGCRSSKVPPW